MNPSIFKGSVILLVMAAIGAGIVALERSRVRLHGEIDELRRQNETLIRAHAADERMPGLAVRSETEQAAATQAVQTEIARLRAEVAGLEKHAREARARMEAAAAARTRMDAASLANGRDPERGLTRLEYFQNLGRATPTAAWQTLVWAAMRGDDAVLASGLILPEPVRARAGALIATLPADKRKETTPEKLAALWFARAALDSPAAEIAGQAVTAPGQTTLTVRGGVGTDGKAQMQLGEGGWQMVVPTRAIEAIEAQVRGATELPAK